MPAKKLRLHIENTRKKNPIFHTLPAHWAAACKRHKALARHIGEVSFGWDGDVLESALANADLLIGVPAQRDRLAVRAPQLKWLHSTSAGVDGVLPLDWLPRGVSFTNNSGAHGRKAEQYMIMAYNLINSRMAAITTNQHRHHWEALFSPSITGKTAVIVGLGDLGEGAARAAKKLGLKVIGVRRSAQKNRYADKVVTYKQLDRVLPQADFVVLAVPLTAETRHLLDGRRMDLLKPSTGVINIARGPVADYKALEQRLRAGRLGGAVLDVVDPEPLPADSSLWTAPNLIITPHISCDDGEHYIDISLDLWFENLALFLAGKKLKRRIDPKLGY
ncbi:MAG: D-2-hydroxyacid dehydrogenase [Burkholderiales bacterium]|jgi:phosphoglycerate dehydrogenase-like enzyme|nr:D-2-hydroxyacid dehydrogenase [Burkholderiales bacterium]